MLRARVQSWQGQLSLFSPAQVVERALKIGITNVGTARLDAFQQRGWVILNLELFEQSAHAAAIELVIKKLWRRDLGLPVWLGTPEMAQTGGWLETISLDLLAPAEVIDRVKAERRALIA